MTIVKHPTANVSRDVPASRVQEWVKAGWQADAPAAVSEVAPEAVADEPTPEVTKRSTRKR